MNDEYVEEIRKIREMIYVETKNMTEEELDDYYRKASDIFEQQIAECRAQKNTEQKVAQSQIGDH